MANELTASTPTLCEGAAAVKTHIDTLTLAATTDHVIVVPCPGKNNVWLAFKVERAAQKEIKTLNSFIIYGNYWRKGIKN